MESDEQKRKEIEDINKIVNPAILETKVDELGLSRRVTKALGCVKITTLGELIGHTPNELCQLRQFSRASLNQVKTKLEEYGLALKNK
ncbi:MAG: DNA-directed RNA polymerase subunit alpha C-terminal domain-containing protein [Nanoarchaeota archaeon]